jgi:hypothetical protein
VLLINRRLVMARAACEAAVARELWRLIGHELERVQDHVLLLSKSAVTASAEKVCSFFDQPSPAESALNRGAVALR